jgi:EpsD family peptidyl-prolyl cis-trans isomerase
MVERSLLVSALIAIAVAVSSCGAADADKPASQIVAKVNGEAISRNLVESVITRGNAHPPEPARRPAAQALERIIDQKLLAQKALEARLDRDPLVMQSIELSKRQILAQAYVERAAVAAPNESHDEIARFYKENPALFEQRRIYRVLELVVAVPQGQLAALEGAAAAAGSLSDVAKWLEFRKLPFNVATFSRPAEHIPMDVLPRLFEMRDGQIAVFVTLGGASVVQLVRATAASVDEQQAAPIIERYLLNRKRFEVALAEVRKLRERAKIEYIGEFETQSPAPAPARPAPRVRPREAPRVVTSASGDFAGLN